MSSVAPIVTSYVVDVDLPLDIMPLGIESDTCVKREVDMFHSSVETPRSSSRRDIQMVSRKEGRLQIITLQEACMKSGLFYDAKETFGYRTPLTDAGEKRLRHLLGKSDEDPYPTIGELVKKANLELEFRKQAVLPDEWMALPFTRDACDRLIDAHLPFPLQFIWRYETVVNTTAFIDSCYRFIRQKTMKSHLVI